MQTATAMHRNVLAALFLLQCIASSQASATVPIGATTIAEIVINITQGTQPSPQASASLQLECASAR